MTSFLLLFFFLKNQNLEPGCLLNKFEFSHPYLPNYWNFSHSLKKKTDLNFQIIKFTTVASYIVKRSNWSILVAIFWTVCSLLSHYDGSHFYFLWTFTSKSTHWQISIIPYGLWSIYCLLIGATVFGCANTRAVLTNSFAVVPTTLCTSCFRPASLFHGRTLLTPLINGAMCNDLVSCVRDKMSMIALSQQNVSLSMKVNIHKPSEMPRVPKTAESDSHKVRVRT